MGSLSKEMSLTARIRERAYTLGFDLVGVTSAQPSHYGEFLADWLAQGYAGEMSYLQRNVEKRLDPRRILPGTRSILAVGMKTLHMIHPADLKKVMEMVT